MPDDKNEKQKRPDNAIPVATMRLLDADVDGIGRDGMGSIASGGEQNRNHWEIVYVPHMRHFRVDFFPAQPIVRADKSKVTQVTRWIHETRVRHWEPA